MVKPVYLSKNKKNRVSGITEPYTIPNDSAGFEGFTITQGIRCLLTYCIVISKYNLK